MSLVYDHDEWLDGFDAHWNYDQSRMRQRSKFRREVVTQFREYQVPVIELGSGTPRQAVCQVFEKVNTGGVTLTVFELLTATYAADDFDLRKDWEQRKASWAAPEFKVLRDVSNTDFLQAVTLLATRAARATYLRDHQDDDRAPRVGCRRTDILNLPLAAYRQWAPLAVAGFKAAAKLMHRQHVFDTRFLPYGSQLIPLAAIFAVLGEDATTAQAIERITRWLWCGVFGELYGGTTETRFARDVPDVVSWVRGEVVEPRTIQEATFAPGRLETLRTRGSAAYKGIYALLMKGQARDWRSGEPMTVTTYFDDYVDIHHIFPRAWCDTQRIPAAIHNGIANKTPLTARTNRVIGGHAPSAYLSRLSSSAQVDPARIEQQVETHLIDVRLLRADDFPSFLAARRQALLRLIGDAMGKTIETGMPGEAVDEPELSDDDLDDE